MQLRSPLPVPSLRVRWGGGGDAGLLAGRALSHLRCLPGLAFFSCVDADTNVTTGHGTEGLACGGAEGCTGKDARGKWRRGGEGRDGDGQGVLSSGTSTKMAKVTRAGGTLQLGPTVGMDQLQDAG